jgi:hypothetical protein
MTKVLAALALTAAGVALAGSAQAGWEFPKKPLPVFPRRPTLAAPEIDSTSAISALTLLIGSVIVLRGRAAKR